MKIKIVLQHFFSNPDVNGNRYWFHKATNTTTGESLLWESPHSSNARSAVMRALDDHTDFLDCGEVGLPIRKFNAIVKNNSDMLFDTCRDEHIVKAIKAL